MNLAADSDVRSEQVKVLARGLSVLQVFVPRNEWLSNQEISERCDLPRPTVSRLTNSLTALGLLMCSPRHGRYRLSLSALSLGFDAFASASPLASARQALMGFVQKHGGVALVAERSETSMVCVEAHQRQDSLLSVRIFQGSRLPLAMSAVGRAWFAAAPEPEQQAVMNRLAQRLGERAKPAINQLRYESGKLRPDGVYLGLENLETGINGLGVALWAHGRLTRFALGAAAPSSHFTAAVLEQDVLTDFLAMRRQIESLLALVPAGTFD
jgi:DNA-binding IclR family transcriptional regulator